ncbi:tyrosine-type recombinase/integrase [Listeria seeligeri]|uniref:tyrosine-type recombinase/integrase n=1 Tax=Listeria seeligeri TaxID=1640 RepID=UPI001627031E|nr:tyrosine-type recombinase/integrase [Listeria seeligeri]MBC1481291.1 tyrosine-type recombinase/integrase [Listeria seeligeri]MBC1721768.1 tyrosine-type recombinase/integrase [Listeria seeligeri]MBC1790428.1 tyrosine-type recombinase/integrase [Listeria seeligeri]MBC1845692.1 tyrosine-type recombinase/integrase [Listeria seeligeri]MBC1858900.1 tyrosine-type recombinase/integrase [Listeria seeligeri]
MEEMQPIKDLKKIALMKDILSRGDFGERNVLLFSIGINTAYRISDLLHLKLSDVLEIYRQKVRVKSRLKMKEQKTEKNNSVILTKKLQKDIWEYVLKEHAQAIQEQELNHYLFTSRKKNGGERPLSRQQGWYIISKAGKKAGLQHLGTHSMRKTFGYHLYNNGVGLELIQLLSNHSSPKITLRYIGIEQEDKDQAVSSLGL